MNLQVAQREVRETYLGGMPGLLFSATVWFVSAALGSWVSWQAAMWALVIGGALIFLCLEFMLRIARRKPSLAPDNPLNPLMLQVAFLLPLLLPLIVFTFLYRQEWLFPAFMFALAAHFLPFMFLFGMWQFGALGIALFLSALVFVSAGHLHFTVPGWYGGTVQLLFAFVGYEQVRRERESRHG